MEHVILYVIYAGALKHYILYLNVSSSFRAFDIDIFIFT